MIGVAKILYLQVTCDLVVIIDGVSNITVIAVAAEIAQGRETIRWAPKECDLKAIYLPTEAHDITGIVYRRGSTGGNPAVAATGNAHVDHAGGFGPDKAVVIVSSRVRDIGPNDRATVVDCCSVTFAAKTTEVTHAIRGVPDEGMSFAEKMSGGRQEQTKTGKDEMVFHA